MTPAQIKGKKVTIVGGQRSGLAVARLLAGAGARVFLTDVKPATAGITDTLERFGVAYEFGGHTRQSLDAELMVVSPGVPSTVNIVQQMLRIGVPVYAELEVASWFCKAPIVAITGSNGKTTTTTLLGNIFTRSGRGTTVAGNIGFPFSDYVTDIKPEDVAILEVSSFQLDHIDTFRPRVSILLNVTPDHLDRYDYSFNNYAQSKFRIFENQRESDVLVYNDDDPFLHEYVTWAARKHGFRVCPVSLEKALDTGAFVRDGALVLRINQQEEILMRVNDLSPSLVGRHNLFNSLAAAAAARAMEVRSAIVRESMASFEGVPHRLEHVREVEGVTYVNDSKATNVNAVWYALELQKSPVVLIAGGRDKGNDYSSLKPLVREKVRAVVALGESTDKVLDELGSIAPEGFAARSMEEALQYARMTAQPGDVVLLSPACASFDMYENYEDRGDTFKRLVEEL